jgi:hypothetical protein
MMPDYTIEIYNDEDLRKVVERNYPQFLSAYDDFPNHINRVDFARYAMLGKDGGIYADMDTVPLKRFDDLVAKNKTILASEPIEHAEALYSRDVVLCNALMVSPPSDFWEGLMKFIIETYSDNNNVVSNTGPMAITRYYEAHPEEFGDVEIVSPCTFFALLDPSNKSLSLSQSKTQVINGKKFDYISKECNLNDAYAVHLWSHKWTEKISFAKMSKCIIIYGLTLLVAVYFLWVMLR